MPRHTAQEIEANYRQLTPAQKAQIIDVAISPDVEEIIGDDPDTNPKRAAEVAEKLLQAALAQGNRIFLRDYLFFYEFEELGKESEREAIRAAQAIDPQLLETTQGCIGSLARFYSGAHNDRLRNNFLRFGDTVPYTENVQRMIREKIQEMFKAAYGREAVLFQKQAEPHDIGSYSPPLARPTEDDGDEPASSPPSLGEVAALNERALAILRLMAGTHRRDREEEEFQQAIRNSLQDSQPRPIPPQANSAIELISRTIPKLQQLTVGTNPYTNTEVLKLTFPERRLATDFIWDFRGGLLEQGMDYNDLRKDPNDNDRNTVFLGKFAAEKIFEIYNIQNFKKHGVQVNTYDTMIHEFEQDRAAAQAALSRHSASVPAAAVTTPYIPPAMGYIPPQRTPKPRVHFAPTSYDPPAARYTPPQPAPTPAPAYGGALQNSLGFTLKQENEKWKVASVSENAPISGRIKVGDTVMSVTLTTPESQSRLSLELLQSLTNIWGYVPEGKSLTLCLEGADAILRNVTISAPEKAQQQGAFRAY